MRLIELGCCGRFAIYIHMELVFNYYFHHSSLILINGDGTANIIQIREGVTQGGPVDMVAYSIGALPLI